MPEQQTQKNHFQLNGGLNTESNEISFPDGFTTDEANYDLLLDGSRRRRKGLAVEASGVSKTVNTLNGNDVTQSFLWRNVGGDPTLSFWVHKIDHQLYFTTDVLSPSSAWRSDSIDLDDFSLSSGTLDQVAVDFTSGKGELFVSSSDLKPLRITYDSVSNVFDIEELSIQVRDFTDIDDGLPINYQPADDGTPAVDEVPADHLYNLMNRGWRQGDILQYATDKSKYPSKNMPWHRAYRRQTDVSYSDLDGIQTFDSNKIEAEATANSSAARGSLLIRVEDDSVGFSESLPGSTASIKSDTSVTITNDAADPWVFTMDETGHTHIVTDLIEFPTLIMHYNNTSGGVTFRRFDGVHEVTAVNANDFSIEVPRPSDYVSISTGPSAYWYDSVSIARSSGTGPITVGPKTIEFHEGRLWYAGVNDSSWADHIFFSQIAQTSYNYKRCHMEADPTDPVVNGLVDTDGGFIVVPNIGNVHKILSVRAGLLVFSDQGVWEITGGRNRQFTPDNYQVRQVTEAECSSPLSPIRIEGAVYYTGPKGIYRISPNQFTGILEAENMSLDRLQTAWNKIGATHQPWVRTVYDDARKRLLFMHGGSGNLRSSGAPATNAATRYYNVNFILDLRTGSWSKYEFRSTATVGVLGAFAISGADDSQSAKKVKYLVQTSATAVSICDMDQTDYLDFDGSESPLPYMLTGWDNIGDFQRRRQAPVVTVFAKRTETGYTATGNGWDGDNESSSLLTAYWDWTDDSVSGKIGSQNETYRHTRGFVPSAADDVNGYPVVVTRNKVRGRGRVLQLRFDGAATKDSHLLGFTTNYKVSRGR
jgi:hypothetical protein